MSMLPIDSAKDDAIAFYSVEYSVCDAIHPEDHIFNFLITHPVFTSDAARVEYYFRDGAPIRLDNFANYCTVTFRRWR